MLTFPPIESLSIESTIAFPNNKILRDAAAREQRIIPHQSPLRKYNVTKKILTVNDADALYTLFNSMNGAEDTFLYLDRSDYQATHTPTYSLAGAYTQGVVLNVGGIYQLFKKYVCGNNVHFRAINHPSDLTIYDSNNTPVTATATNGVIAGLTGTGHTATFNFKVPCRFETDNLEKIISTPKNDSDRNLFSLNSVILSECREESAISVTDTFNDDLEHAFNVNFLLNATLSENYATDINILDSGFENRIKTQDDAVSEIVLGTRSILTQKTIDYMINLWLNTKGCGAFFNLTDSDNTSVKARFDNTPLTYLLKAPYPDPLYEIKGLKARLFYEGILADTGHNGWTGPVLTLCDCNNIAGFGYTTHDRDLTIDGTVYSTRYSFTPTALETTANLAANNSEFRFINNTDITEEMLFNGSLQNENVIFLQGVDWRNLPATINDHLFKQIGQVGKVDAFGDDSFAVENATEFARKLGGASTYKTSPLCSRKFCDNMCKLNIATYTHTATVTDVVSQTEFAISNSNNFSFGTITFTAGANTGCTFAIAEGFTGNINITTIPEGKINVGDTVIAVRGCAKTEQACKDYSNFINFDGIPTGGDRGWMPGQTVYSNPPIVR